MEEDVYDPKGVITKQAPYPGRNITFANISPPLTAKENDEFHIGRRIPDETVVCKICGSDKFYVGRGDCHTSIKCPVCEYEICIHEG